MPIVQVAGHLEAHGCLHELKGPHADENAVVQVEEPLACEKKIHVGALKTASARATAAWTTPPEISAAGSFSTLRRASEIKLTIFMSAARSSISGVKFVCFGLV